MSRNPSGENRVVEAERDALRRAGHDVGLVTVRTDDLEHRPGYAVRAAARVATGFGRSPVDQLRQLGPDVVHVHNLFPNFGRRWVDDVSAPVVHTLHNYRPMCAAGTLYRAGAVCTLCPDGDRWAGLRHACYRDSRAATLPLTIGGLGGAGADPLLRRADRLVVMSEQMKGLYAADGVDPGRMVVWPNFLPRPLEPVAPPSGSRSSWLHVGRLSAEKGVVELVRAWPSDQHLRIVGDGPLRDVVASEARGRPIELLGATGRTEVLEEMSRARGLVFASRWLEGFPLTYVEALACGLPTVAVGPNVLTDVVARDGTGVCGDDVSQLPELLARLHPSEELSAHCRRVFQRSHTEASHVDRALTLYEDLVARRRSAGG